MWKKPGTAVPIDASQLVVGLYIWLDLRWDEHAFLTNRLLLKTEHEIAIIQSYNTAGRLYYYPEKSTTRPSAASASPPVETAAEAASHAAEHAALMQELAQAEKIKKEKFRQQKDAAARADRAWEKAASAAREGLQNMSRSPKTAGEQLALLSRETASTIAQGQEVLLHLLGDKKDQGPQFHALNAMTLCMLVGKKAALVGGGSWPIWPWLLWPTTRANHKFRRKSCGPGRVRNTRKTFTVSMCSSASSLRPSQVLSVARPWPSLPDHHEALDGSGLATRQEGSIDGCAHPGAGGPL
jgi:hypothetical protein